VHHVSRQFTDWRMSRGTDGRLPYTIGVARRQTMLGGSPLAPPGYSWK
jgi:hypothetical protein